ncbi:MAG: hypothetical protein AAB691_00225 [Patescibacteria group bacterium]
MNTLAGIGMGLVGVFIPIYLLELGYAFPAVILWLLIHHSSLLVGAFLVVFISNSIGLVRCWYIRVFLVSFLFGGLFLLPSQPSFLYTLAVISGMEAAFFWIPYNILTVRKTEDATMGSSLALMSNIGSGVGIIVPGIAAILIVTFGYGVLFATALFFILVSIFPTLPLRDEKTNFHFDRAVVKKIVKENKRFIVPEILDNLGQDTQVIWTLFIFITGLTVLDIGALGIITGIIGMGVTYITGSMIDTWNKKTVVRIGAVLATIMWGISYFVAVYAPTPATLYLVTAIRGLVLGVFVSAYGVIMFNQARHHDAQFLVLREIPTIFGRIILFVATLVLISIGRFEFVFLLAALSSLYFCFNNIDALMEAPKNNK